MWHLIKEGVHLSSYLKLAQMFINVFVWYCLKQRWSNSIMQELLFRVKFFYKTSTVIINVKEGIELFEINHKFSTILVYLWHTTNTLPTRIQAVQNQLRSNNLTERLFIFQSFTSITKIMLHTFFIIHFGCNQTNFKPIFSRTRFSVKYYFICVYCSFISMEKRWFDTIQASSFSKNEVNTGKHAQNVHKRTIMLILG